MAFKVCGSPGNWDTATAGNHVCKVGSCASKVILRWNQEKALAYVKCLVGNTELMNQFDEAEANGDADKLASCLRLLIVQAASDRAVGMTSWAKCARVRAKKQKGPLSLVWFNDECKLKRKLFLKAIKRGKVRHA